MGFWIWRCALSSLCSHCQQLTLRVFKMRVRKLIFIMSFLFLLGCNMSGCKLFSTEAIVDTKTDEDGRLVLLDPLRHWQDFRATVDLQVANEKAGTTTRGGARWNAHWFRRDADW